MTVARSWLFVPGDSARKIERALAGDADALIIDWEDAVAPDAKSGRARGHGDHARLGTSARGALLDPRQCARFVLFAADVGVLPVGAIAGVVLPKACGLGDLGRLAAALDRAEAAAGRSSGELGVVAIVTETAASVLALSEFRRAVPRLVALMWGAEDLAGDLGVARNRDAGGAYRAPFRLARNLMLLAAGAAQCSAIDAVRVDFRDLDALATEAAEARADGFTAKAAIHPDQIAPINRVFAVTDEERDSAERVVAALARGGIAVVDGKMVDAPHLRLARRILSRRAKC